MPDPEEEKPPTHTLMVHPFTHEVYRLPDMAMLFDRHLPMQMNFESFQKLATSSSFCAERLLNYTKDKNQTWDVNTMVVIEYGNQISSKERRANAWRGTSKRCLWATRMCTEFPDEPEYRDLGLTGSVGGNFLWPWPPAKAWNTWAIRHEKLNNPCEDCSGTSAAIGEHEIDDFPLDKAPHFMSDDASPDFGHILLPTNIPGAKRVPLEQLEPKDRFFLACIVPQDSNFARLNKYDDYRERYHRMVFERQANEPDRLQRWARPELTVDGGVPSRESCIRAILQVNEENGRQCRTKAALQKRERRQKQTLDLLNRIKHPSMPTLSEADLLTRPDWHEYGSVEILGAREDAWFFPKNPKKRKHLDQQDAQPRHVSRVANGSANPQALMTWYETDMVREYQRNVSNWKTPDSAWDVTYSAIMRTMRRVPTLMETLPDDVQTHIFAHATSLAMSSDTNTCSQTLQTLSLLCKASNHACKKIVHNRVVQLRSEFDGVLTVKPETSTPITVGTRMRSIGLSPNCSLILSRHVNMPVVVTPRVYMEARLSLGTDVTDTALPRPTETSEIMRRTMARLVAINPGMYALLADHSSKEDGRTKRRKTEGTGLLSTGLLSTHRNDLESLMHEEVVTCLDGR
tara:strand:- start:1809 stop:3698 length:1890 start_codon:yes stop_codon:yes gene_type:complete